MVVNARLALICHGVMAAEKEAGRWHEKVVKAPRSGVVAPVASVDVREEYDFEMRERAFKYMDAGISDERAFERAYEEMGCAEVWDLLRGWPQDFGTFRNPVARETDDTCSRCESIGHEVARCPYPAVSDRFRRDEALQVQRIAEARRVRRGKVAA
jgi:hypothetical protein